MIQRWHLLLYSALLLSMASQNKAAAQGSQLPPPIGPAVQVYFTASVKDGFSAMLTPSELTAFIDKQPAQIASLHSAKEEKLVFVLMIDTSRSEASKAESIKMAATKLFQSLLVGDNQGYIEVFDSQAVISKRPLQISEIQKAINGIRFGGPTALFDALGDTCSKILSRSGNPNSSRRAIILISDGDDNQSHIDHMKVEETAEIQGIPIFSLATATSSSHGARFLQEAGQMTGGRVVFAEQPENGVQPLLDAIYAQWVLSLVPLQASDQKLHSLTIKSIQKDIHITVPSKIILQ